MKIKVLDRIAIGIDTPLEALYKFGDVTVYDDTSNDKLLERCADADILIFNKIKITKEVFENSKSLKLLCVFATGYDNIDVDSAKEYNVAVCNVPGYSTESVTLFTVATVLALTTKLREYTEFVRSGAYSASKYANRLTPVYHEITGKTWGIIGCGNIGSSVAKVATSLGARVIVNKRIITPDFNCVDIDTLCKESDIITIHCPLTPETLNLIDKNRISLMKNSVILVNEARGAVLCERDVTDAVKSGKISAFGCDVYSEEPFRQNHPYYEIKSFDNVLLTPHVAWSSYQARSRCAEIISENIASYLNGGIKNRVDLP